MSRRSASNDRYQRKDKKAGSTRRSASSAKPKRAAGSATSSASRPAKKQPEKKKSRFFQPLPTTPEIKKWRRVWFVMIVIALAGFAVAMWADQTGQAPALRYIPLAVEVGGVSAAIAIDIFVIRKLRKQALKDEMAGTSGKKKHS
ncbi:MAG: hypothetical protein QMC79_08330 [Anaerosomatales bacterium]|nr:hypothetical protein [Anaerosomatales bacterium]